MSPVKTIHALLCNVLLLSGALYSQYNMLEIDRVVNEFYSKDKFNGSVLIGDDSGIIYEKGFGYANMEHNIPNTPHTKFRIASITKPFTAMLIMQMFEEGKIKLNATVSEYLPEYPKKYGSKITIHQLLNHTSGLGHYELIPDFFRMNSYLPYSHQDFIKTFCDVPLLFEPGIKCVYSSLGYYLLGIILEKVSGKTYSDLLKDRIVKKLNLPGTGVDDNKSIEVNRASGYRKTSSGYQNSNYRDMSTAFATGNMISTVKDLYNWERAFHTDKLLTAKSKRRMLKPNSGGFGYGWSIGKTTLSDGRAMRTISHSGTTNGFRSITCRYIEKNTTIILLCNTENSSVNEVCDALKKCLIFPASNREKVNCGK